MAKKLETYLNLTVTTALGIAGAVTGNVGLQIAALCPAVACQISGDIGEQFLADKELRHDLTELIKAAGESTEKKMPYQDQKDLLHASISQIETALDHKGTVEEYIKTVLNEMSGEFKKAVVDKTDLDEIKTFFIKEILIQMPYHSKVEDMIFRVVLLDHEQRITHLEEKALPGIVRNTIVATEISDDTQYYCDKFEEPLFLHRGLPKEKTVCLKDVYMLPEIQVTNDYQWYQILARQSLVTECDVVENDSLMEGVRKFLEYAPQKPGERIVDILFIEGHAAMGKSSFISYLSWLYKNKKDDQLSFFKNRKLITIRLREIPRSGETLLNIPHPFLQLCSYLLKMKEKDLQNVPGWEKSAKTFLSNTILVLEGFDELCMMEGIIGKGKIQYFQNLYQELNYLDCNCKVIVTTRPEYINVEAFDFPKAHMMICPFTRKERDCWLKKYEIIYQVPLELREILVSGTVSSLEGIVDCPLTLYMIVAKNIFITEDSNLWYIYHQIFAEEIYERNYEKGSPHAINEYKDVLFRLTTEIANVISMEHRFCITVQNLLDIGEIRNLLCQVEEKKDIQAILEDCFGLASYFRITDKESDPGKIISAVEFYHNNIKDYFYSEYLWLSIKEIYEKIPADLKEQDAWFMSSYQELFQYSDILMDNANGHSRVLEFFRSKISYLKENETPVNFIRMELKERYFKRFFGKMLQTGVLHHYTYTEKENILDLITNIYNAVFLIYHELYCIYLPEDARMELVEDDCVDYINESSLYCILVSLTSIYDYTRIKFDKIFLSEIQFMLCNFQNSSFKNSVLIDCSFSDCNLCGVDFSDAVLNNVDFSQTIMDKNTIFSKGTKFRGVKIRKNQVSYFNDLVKEKEFLEKEGEIIYVENK